MTADRDYVLGTHDVEIARLGLQHRVWRARVLDVWRRAGVTIGETVLDVGSGPGYATLDLAEIVGPAGRVIALERSRRFIDALEAQARERRIEHITTHEMDLDDAQWPRVTARHAWCRWVATFVKDPRGLIAHVHEALEPGGTFVIHEYLNYGTWQFLPPSAIFEEFVDLVIDNWRASGGEPNIGRDLPAWLEESGFALTHVVPIVEMTKPGDFLWHWPKAFVEAGLDRMVSTGRLDQAKASAILNEFVSRERAPHTRMVTPLMIEIIATRR